MGADHCLFKGRGQESGSGHGAVQRRHRAAGSVIYSLLKSWCCSTWCWGCCWIAPRWLLVNVFCIFNAFWSLLLCHAVGLFVTRCESFILLPQWCSRSDVQPWLGGEELSIPTGLEQHQWFIFLCIRRKQVPSVLLTRSCHSCDGLRRREIRSKELVQMFRGRKPGPAHCFLHILIGHHQFKSLSLDEVLRLSGWAGWLWNPAQGFCRASDRLRYIQSSPTHNSHSPPSSSSSYSNLWPRCAFLKTSSCSPTIASMPWLPGASPTSFTHVLHPRISGPLVGLLSFPLTSSSRCFRCFRLQIFTSANLPAIKHNCQVEMCVCMYPTKTKLVFLN